VLESLDETINESAVEVPGGCHQRWPLPPWLDMKVEDDGVTFTGSLASGAVEVSR